MKSLIQKIKVLLAARKLVKDAKREVKMNGETKPGWQTTEFWGKVLIQLVLVFNAFSSHDISIEQATLLITALEGIYMTVRSLVKSAKDVAGLAKNIVDQVKGKAEADA